MATTPITPPVGSSAQQTLSEWAGPYVTNMLGKTEAVASQPYQVYGGPMTAGASDLQNKVFQGLGNLSFPSNLGQSFASPIGGTSAIPPYATSPAAPSAPKTEADWNTFQQMASFSPGTNMEQAKADFMSGGKGGYNGPEMGAVSASGAPSGISGLTEPQASMQPSNVAQTYMNPYLQAVLQPQLDELRRQNAITNVGTNAKLTQAGAFGGGRQAIMNAENDRNMLAEMNKTVGTGYANAYDKAMQQFNTEQGQAKTLADMLSGAGQTQRGIEQEGITSDYNEFLAQRDYPQKMLQFQQSMLQGLPISTVSNQAASQSGIGQLSSTIGGLGNILESLKKFNLAP